MADVRGRDAPRRDEDGSVHRGQLLLVMGVMIALTLVFLAVLLNSVIYAENLGTRGSDIGGNDAVQFESAVQDAGEGFVTATNRDADSQDHDPLVSEFDESIADWDDLSRSHLVRDGHYASLSFDRTPSSPSNGSQIRQSESGSFQNANDESAWAVVENADVRNYSMTIHDVSDDFLLSVSTADGEWNLTVGDGSETTVTTERDGNVIADCTVHDEPFEIDFVAGTVDGDYCNGEPVTFAGDLEAPYGTIEYANASAVEGTYTLTVNSTDPLSSNSFNQPGEDEPVAVAGIYAADVSLMYETERIEYESTVTAAPNTHYGR
ncbi:hypothetical protein EA462_07415 [Natrarchaeobius halalkaliphilus]|uniref:Uncharacterized protein n=1 Tax=Natrarchaeobius halalkaliphilus TaxID=1679091 RepID=A0A3N6LLR7_9EURY|nr:hypothetical protein [Natrarchaeobius halalkaliphilus]RQG89838.1 hypothetical protein EA462_07415 [Natrarchaeobius halalkaliphilus]